MGKVQVAAIAAFGLVLGSVGAACGGSDSSVSSSPEDGGAEAAAADAGPYTLDNVCARTGPIVCNLRKSCCEKATGYDEAGCLAHAKAECEKDVADTRAGRATFFPERVDPCIEKYKSIFEECTVSVALYLRVIKDLRECRLFDGQLTENASCERDSQCKQSAVPTEFVSCDDARCTTTKLLSEGEACQFGDGVHALCDRGLYCDVNFASQPFTGTCKKATAPGQKCDGSKKPVSLECGFGYYCDTSTGICTSGKGGGASCENDLQCASSKCSPLGDAGDAGMACLAPEPIAKQDECKGP